MNCKIIKFLLGISASVSSAAMAQVESSSTNGFHIKQQVVVAGSVKKAYQALFAVEHWWHPDHTWFGKAENLSLEAKLGGCFCERSEQGQAEHLRVVYLKQNEEVRLTGGLGPLQQMGIQGTLTFTFTKAENGTEITQQYQVVGFYPEGMQMLAPVVDKVQTSQLNRLAQYIEHNHE